ncbi:MAG: penicillin-binding protein [Parcubacteria group bacterium]|nr:penicillin-binding protein [Parcubacteria group bacterium]MCR4342799.1 penicillin-binding protein [Patescibacteria group bacterium]
MLHKKIMKDKGFISIKGLIAASFIILFTGGGIFLLWANTLQMPDFGSFEQRKIIQSTKIYDKTGKVLLYDVHQNIQRTVVSLEKISRHIKNATVAIEDAEFYQHSGIRPTAIFRAVFIQPLKGKGVQGGSTITQQVIKNTLLSREKKISRKLKEAVLSLRLEKLMSKDEILNIYLNEAPYGGSIYGTEEAAMTFFGKNAQDVTLAEAAYLAAIPKAPTFYSPYGNNRDKLDERKNIVLNRMLELGFVSEKDAEEAKNEEVYFVPRSDQGILAPHFVIFIKSYLEEKYGKDLIEEGGLKVTTTLDYKLQEKAEKIVAEYGQENEEKFNASNAGMVGIDPKTGQILVMVGSRDYFNAEKEGNFNVTLAKRQPGSAFKPFVYATAFKKGFTPDTVVFDLQTEFQSNCKPDGTPKYTEVNPDDCYHPGNYDGIFHGPISFRDALAQSINIPAVKALYLAGLQDSLQTAKDMGISTLSNVNQYGLTLVLGGGEVTPLDITGAYGAFATGGIKNPTTGILKIEDNNGKIIEEFSPEPKRVLDENIALMISDILSDNNARTPAFGSNSYLYFPEKDVAAKTGTTNDYKDAWIVGYTPNFALGAWAGNNNNSEMEKKVAGFIVAPMWNTFFKEVLIDLPEEKFKEPNIPIPEKPILHGIWQGGESYFIDKISKKLATEFTPLELREERVVTDVHSILYWVDKNNPLGPKPEEPENDLQFELWEDPVLKWVENQKIKTETANDTPKEFDDVHKPEFMPKINIIEPKSENIYNKNDKITLQIQNYSKFPISRVDIFLNNIYLGSTVNAPFNFSFNPNNTEGLGDKNELKVIVYDSVKNKGETTMELNIGL